MKRNKIKRLLVVIRKFLRLFFVPEENFEKEYSDNRINYIVSELMLMSINERFKIIKIIQDEVLKQSIQEKDELSKKLEKIIKVLDEYEKI